MQKLWLPLDTLDLSGLVETLIDLGRWLDVSEQQPTILLVGTGHWDNPGKDYRAVTFDDMLTPDRQRQIEECLALLAMFEPTKVALETLPESERAWNADYQAFRAGSFTLTAGEHHQLGFRLAEMTGHDRIFGIDWHDFTRPIEWEQAITFALTHDQGQYITALTESQESTEESERRLSQRRVRDILLQLNAPDTLAESHRVYMDLAQVGAGNERIGAEVVMRWYERNMMMFVNLARLASAPNERVLVVVGAGHVPLLTHFVLGAKRFRLEQVSAYLKS